MSQGPPQSEAVAPAGQEEAPPVAVSSGLDRWSDQLTERVVDGVERLRAKTTVPLVKAMRAIVFGLAAIVSLVVAGVLGLIGITRLWDVYVPVHPLGRRVWLGYAVFGCLFFLAGVALLARRTAGRDKP